MEHLLWSERYRPKTIEECILPASLKIPFKEYVAQKEIPNLLLTGTPGVGKTTVAKAMCDEIGCDYLFINGSDERGISVLRGKISNYASSLSFSGGRKVIIIDEADNLTHDAQDAFRGAIEEFSLNCSFIFTCNFHNKLIDAIHSRCAVINFKIGKDDMIGMMVAFSKSIHHILDDNGIEYDKKVIGQIINKYFPDYRRTINELQRYSKYGKIDVGIMALTQDIDIKELMGFIKNKDYTASRKWIVQNNDIDSIKIFRKIYDAAPNYIKPELIPQMVLHLADYQYKAAFVADHEINIMSCLVEIMTNCEMK